jgi:hypothetical protein
VKPVVAHYQDGTVLKGLTNDFFPAKDLFHLTPDDDAAGGGPVEVMIPSLKAVFFVRDLKGSPDHQESKTFDQPMAGRKIRVLFKDGEELVGTTNGYQPGRPGFFLFPADGASNNERCFVVSAATKEITFL